MAEEKDKPVGITMADIRKVILETVADATKGLTGSKDDTSTDDSKRDSGNPLGSRTDRATGVQDLVKAEIEKIKAKEAAEARDKTIDEQLAALADKTKEQPPVERSKRHRFMGWGE
jgi:hypothetical protein